MKLAHIFLIWVISGTEIFSPSFASNDVDLVCSACKLTTSTIQSKYAGLTYGKTAKMSRKSKAKAVTKAMDSTCKELKSGNMAVVGEEGSREYKDFNKMMSEGGTMTNMQMGGHISEQLAESCESLVAQYGEVISEGFVNVDRAYDFKIEGEICYDACSPDAEEDEDTVKYDEL